MEGSKVAFSHIFQADAAAAAGPRYPAKNEQSLSDSLGRGGVVRGGLPLARLLKMSNLNLHPHWLHSTRCSFGRGSCGRWEKGLCEPGNPSTANNEAH